MMPRTDTPDAVTIHPDGRKTTTMRLKRCCNGCGTPLGDVDNRDVDADGNLTDVRGECDHCRPLVEAEAAGCKTWHLLPDMFRNVEFDVVRRVASAHRVPDEHGDLRFLGISIATGSGEPLTVLWDDWIIQHPDGTFTVHKAPGEVA